MRSIATWIICIASSHVTLAATTYSYDAAGHLIAVNYGNGSTISYTYDLTGNLISRSIQGGSTGPVITSVTTAFAGSVIAENTYIVIKGTSLVPANTPASGAIWSSAPSFASGMMPTQLNSVSVTVNNKPAFVYFYCSAATDPACSQDQLNILTPLDSTIGPVPVVVTNGSISTAPFTVNMQAVAPSFLLFSTAGYVVATHLNNSLLGPIGLYPTSTPASPGETIILYAVGFGLPSIPLTNGSASQSGSLPVLPVCQVAGSPAALTFAGLVESGLYQLNLTIPLTASTGDNAVSCTYNGSTTPAGDLITVQAPTVVVPPAQPTWTQLTSSGATPSGRETPSAVFDPLTNRLILFGGIAVTGSCCNSYNDVWVLTNANGLGGTPSWTQLTPSAPSGLPPARSSHSAIYDPATNRMVVFGGGQFGGSIFNTLFNDVWVLTNADGVGGIPTWLPLSPVGGPPAPREGQHTFYDSQNNRMTVFGGGNNGIEDVPNDVWVLSNANGLGGTPTWLQLSPAGVAPSARENFAEGYDPASNRMMIFGGCCYWTNDTWVLTNANGLGGTPQWAQQSPAGTLPSIRQTPAFGYDPAGNFLLIFGMGNNAGSLNDTWQLLNANGSAGTPQWVNLIPANSPNAPPIISGYNTSSASSYDITNQRLISLKNVSASTGGAVLQTWVLTLH